MAHHWGEVVEKLRRVTVAIRSGSGTASGSGVVWRPDGRIVTNAHVVAALGRGPLEVEFWDGRRAAAQVVERSRRADLASVALLNQAEVEAATAGQSAGLRPGEVVVAVGNPLGFTGAASSGVVHAVPSAASAAEGDWRQRWVVSQLRLAPGNSGGPLANARGEVVGINTMVYNGLALSVPSEVVEEFLGAAGGGAARLGVNLRAVRWQARRLGFLVMEIEPGSAAEAASLLAGDVLVGAGGRIFASLADLQAAVARAASSGEALPVDFVRGADRGRVRSVTVKLPGGPGRAAAAAAA